MNTALYEIKGGDYMAGGSGSKQLKETLKRIGVDAKTIRRVMVAAYESEMNVVIHAERGVMKVAVDPTQVDVVVEDEGPGIADVELAMREGYSTAPAEARDMGFGAGMGLPNIQRNSDQFSIQSTVGKGTQLRFRVFLEAQEASAGAANSVHVAPERCRQCLLCLHACPTQAIRVRNDRPEVLDHLCVDCTACLAACEPKALTLDGLDALPEPGEDTVLVLPVSFLEQFGKATGPQEVLGALGAIGFKHIRLSDEWDQALRAAVVNYAREKSAVHPVISPACPAVVNLIRLRYPSLMGHVAPFMTPTAAAREELTGPHVVFVALCPAHQSVLRAPSLLTRIDVVSATALEAAVAARTGQGSGRNESTGEGGDPDVFEEGHVLAVSGMAHVAKVLDQVENGLMDDCAVIEPYACTRGCFGSPVWREDPFVAYRRYRRGRQWYEDRRHPDDAMAGGGIVCRTDSLSARSGVRLDGDMRKAIEKLARIDALTRRLPGRNCGVCGAPTCAALAEDVVMGRAVLSDCAYLDTREIEEEA